MVRTRKSHRGRGASTLDSTGDAELAALRSCHFVRPFFVTSAQSSFHSELVVGRFFRPSPWLDLWVLRSGARWADLPDRHPPYQTCRRRFQEWSRDGTWKRILYALAKDLKDLGRIQLTESFIDGTFAGAKKGGPPLEKPSAGTARNLMQDGRPLRRYRRRWKIERLFAWLQNVRRFVTRYEYHAENFLGFVLLGCVVLFLRALRWDFFDEAMAALRTVGARYQLTL